MPNLAVTIGGPKHLDLLVLEVNIMYVCDQSRCVSRKAGG